MENLYLHDDRDAFIRHLQERNLPVLVVGNAADGEERRKGQVEEPFEHLFQKGPRAPPYDFHLGFHSALGRSSGLRCGQPGTRLMRSI
jgi:hypothetical protein